MTKTVNVPVEPTEEMLTAGYMAATFRGYRTNRPDLAAEYKAMIAAAPPADEWQPIETAPDGLIEFLAYRPGTMYPIGVGSKLERDDGVIWIFNGESAHEATGIWDKRPITHWQPLPKPPKEEQT